jgi:hypothetical protein
MIKVVSPVVLIFALLSLTACQTVPLTSELSTADNLEVSFPTQTFDLSFVHGYKEVKKHHYYFESSRWLNRRKDLEFYVSYHFLFDNFIFTNQPSSEELIKKMFEDRVKSIGDTRKILATQEAASDSNEHISLNPWPINKPETQPDINQVISVSRFTLDDANCYLFQRFYAFGTQGFDYIKGGTSNLKYQGDAKLSGYLCNYGVTQITDRLVDEFIRNINVGKVFVSKHIDELENAEVSPEPEDSNDKS